MKSLNENLSGIFDINPLNLPSEQNNQAKRFALDDEFISSEQDFTYARKNLKTLIAKGEEAMEGLLRVASESEQPRAYEVTTSLIKTLADLNKDLMDIHKKRKELKPANKQNEQNSTVNVDKAIFVGPTKEIIKLIKQNMDEE